MEIIFPKMDALASAGLKAFVGIKLCNQMKNVMKTQKIVLNANLLVKKQF